MSDFHVYMMKICIFALVIMYDSLNREVNCNTVVNS